MVLLQYPSTSSLTQMHKNEGKFPNFEWSLVILDPIIINEFGYIGGSWQSGQSEYEMIWTLFD